jgi:hypothetical protein
MDTTGTRRLHHSKRSNNILVESEPAQIGQGGLVTGLFDKIWFRKNSSFLMTPQELLEEDDDDRDVDYDTSIASTSEFELNLPSLLDISPRSNDSDAYDDMFATPKAPTSSLGALCGMSLCLNGDDSPSSSQNLHYATQNMSRDIQRISQVLGEPLRLVLDLKSRRVPPKVWSRLIDSMRSRGLVVEGIGSFDMDELRVIAKSCSCPLTPILFFHSVGDLQRACHANEVRSRVLLLHACHTYSHFTTSTTSGKERRHRLLQRRFTHVETFNDHGSRRTRMLWLHRKSRH